MTAVAKTTKRTTLYVVLVGVVLRLGLAFFFQDAIKDNLTTRVEIATPVTSYKRLTEGLYLAQNGVAPYDGGVFHQAPLLLVLFQFARRLPELFSYLLYTIVDVVIALELQKISAVKELLYLNKRKLEAEAKENPNAVEENWLISALYLFNPYSVLTSLARSTIVFTNLCVILAFSTSLRGNKFWSMFWVAMAAYLSFYPIMLVFPVVMILAQGSGRSLKAVALSSAPLLVVCLGALLGVSYLLVGSWQFIPATYGVILFVSDLTPNIGLFWYFFIELFEQFRSFFLLVFQFHVFVFALPVCIRFREHPLFAGTILCGIIGIFKSYPSIGDASLYLGLLPVYHELFKYMRYNFLVANLFLYSSALAPIFWHLWIYQGSGNANFFYAITLVYGVGQIILIIDVTYAMLRREFDLDHPEHRTKLLLQK
ncbi:PIG-U-domain-containing protein [Basidiobolus meristosporus CBS 931.73]|uniref:PIG-U-domain-containing protein n=1 Tax=Basidiobolus meristosporus CBS 931.73 TaxID=1314790 RepID=A0A1Y1XZX2_9FUNG|nr:PIG-U-domain-containing protein [Basidiobolus meristosporus CBS 931.73]|eukprot:ORX90914.1 PIG-U-domain-containing protein [Basidiobolus meristosporus CBS 931.73]